MRRFLFQNFLFIFNIDYWLKRRLTPLGVLALGTLIFAGVFGVDTRQTFAYQFFSILFALFFIAYLSSWLFRLNVQAQRRLPRYASVGEPLYYQVYLKNKGKRVEKGLQLLENLRIEAPNYDTFIQAKEVQQKQNWFDDYVGYPRWLRLMEMGRRAEVETTAIPPLPPASAHSGMVEMRVKLTPLHRGYVYFNGMTFARPDPFNLFNAWAQYQVEDSLLVLPKRYPVATPALSGSRKYQQGGVHLAISVGDAQEFAALRDYRAGDPLQHIHWKSMAKRDKPVVREFQDEFFVRHALVLDTFSDQPLGKRFEAAVSVAASFAGAPRNHEMLLDLMFVGNQAHCFTSGRGVSQTEKLLEVLACVSVCRDKPFDSLLPLVKAHLSSLSACICILLDWDEPRRQLITFLQQSGVDLSVFIVSPVQLSPDDLQHFNNLHQLRPDRLAEDLAALQ